MTLPINQPYPLFADRDGKPLDQGYIYVGVAGANPETSPIQLYWDTGLTLAAAQPLRTVNGYIARNGTPAAVYAQADSVSMTVKDKGGVLISYTQSVASASLASVAAAQAAATAASNSAAAAAASAAAAAAAANGVLSQAQLEDYLSKIRVPIGAIFPWSTTTAPYGYLICDGSAVSRTQYSDLFAVIGTTYGVGDGSTTYNLPETRAEFIRGLDLGRAIDVGRTIGSAQSDQNKAHTHFSFKINGSPINPGTSPLSATNYPARLGQTGGESNYNIAGTSDTADGGLTSSSGGTEVRVRNVAFPYIIKAFDSPLSQTPPQVTVTESTTTRNLALVDQSKYIRCTNAGTTTINIPTNASIAFPVDTEITFLRASGSVQFSAAVGVTLNAAGTVINEQWRAATLKKVATDTWDLIGAVW